MKTGRTLALWMPVLPFVLYWAIAYVQFQVGKFSTPALPWELHAYTISFYLLFILFYKLGLNLRKEPSVIPSAVDDRRTVRILKISSMMVFIGTLLFVYDRISSGASSLDLIQNEFDRIREDYSTRTSFITTVAVIPQAFRIVAVASYFYALHRKLQIPKLVHLFIAGTVIAELLNMVMSANRGALFWILSYALFYLVYIRRYNLRELFRARDLKIKILLLASVVVAYSYFVWVAENRVVRSTAEYLGAEAYQKIKQKDAADSDDVNYRQLGGEYQIFYYLTHGFQYTAAILKHAPVFNFDLLSPLGIRIESQIARYVAGYQFPAKRNINSWLSAEGLSLSGWPSIFGASLAYFGIVGSLAFSMVLGFASGRIVRGWLRTRRLGWMILTLLLFSSLNMSFDWIIRNFDQLLALAVGLGLILTRSGGIKSANLRGDLSKSRTHW